jgi:hypothetical protein
LNSEGKIKYLGLSEVSSDTLRRACKVHHIDAVQIEYSPFAIDIEQPQIDLLKTCRELGVATIAYSPLGRFVTIFLSFQHRTYRNTLVVSLLVPTSLQTISKKVISANSLLVSQKRTFPRISSWSMVLSTSLRRRDARLGNLPSLGCLLRVMILFPSLEQRRSSILRRI